MAQDINNPSQSTATPKNQLKKWFVTAAKPNQAQFHAWIDAFWHKSESIPMGYITGLSAAIAGKADAEQLQHYAKKDTSNIDVELWRNTLGVQDFNPADFVDKTSAQQIAGNKEFIGDATYIKNLALYDEPNDFYYNISVSDCFVIIADSENQEELVISKNDKVFRIFGGQSFAVNYDFEALTTPRTFAYPNKSGVFAMLSDIPAFTPTNYGNFGQMPYMNPGGSGFSYNNRFMGGVTAGGGSRSYFRFAAPNGTFSEINQYQIIFSNDDQTSNFNIYPEGFAIAGDFEIEFQAKSGKIALLSDIADAIAEIDIPPVEDHYAIPNDFTENYDNIVIATTNKTAVNYFGADTTAEIHRQIYTGTTGEFELREEYELNYVYNIVDKQIILLDDNGGVFSPEDLNMTEINEFGELVVTKCDFSIYDDHGRRMKTLITQRRIDLTDGTLIDEISLDYKYCIIIDYINDVLE